MLVYPHVGRSLRLRYRLLGIPVLVATVDLSKEWHNIEEELHGLLNDCAIAARQSREQGTGTPNLVSLNNKPLCV
jgi:5-methylcytosine-specific restriction enzyme subunit McrC